MNKRQIRIHHRERLKKKRSKYNWMWNFMTNSYSDNPVWLGKVLNTPKMCNCWMCANQRKHHGKTMQELRNYQPKLQETYYDQHCSDSEENDSYSSDDV